MSGIKFIGIGTGSCGSSSFAEMIKNCGIECVHEGKMDSFLPWGYSKEKIVNKLKVFKEKDSYGEVGLFFLPYVTTFLAEIPDIKVLCLKRDRSKTIRTMAHTSLRSNPFSLNYENVWEKSGLGWDLSYPKYSFSDEKTIEEVAGEFYDSYYYKSSILERLFPGRVKIFDIEKINTNRGQDEIYNFIGIPKENRNYKKFVKNVHFAK